MVKKLFYLGVFTFALAVLIPVLSSVSWGVEHQPLSASEVEQIVVWSDGGAKTQHLDQSDVQRVLEWFNSASSLLENKELQGTTPSTGMTLHLKQGGKIQIWPSAADGYDIEVGGRGTSPYWAKQPELRTFIQDHTEPRADAGE